MPTATAEAPHPSRSTSCSFKRFRRSDAATQPRTAHRRCPKCETDRLPVQLGTPGRGLDQRISGPPGVAYAFTSLRPRMLGLLNMGIRTFQAGALLAMILSSPAFAIDYSLQRDL